jgi:hypothetical protein
MTDNVKRILEMVEMYISNINDQIKKCILNKYDHIIETDDAIKLYVKREDPVQIDLFLYAIIELGINKKLELYEEFNPQRDVCPDEILEVGIQVRKYVLRYSNCIVSLKNRYMFLRAIFSAERFNSLNLFKKLLELGYITDADKLKMVLQNISNVEFRVELINYINTLSNDNDGCNIGL